MRAEIKQKIQYIENSLRDNAVKYFEVYSDNGNGYNCVLFRSSNVDSLKPSIENEIKNGANLIKVAVYRSTIAASKPINEIVVYEKNKTNNNNLYGAIFGEMPTEYNDKQKIVYVLNEYKNLKSKYDELSKEYEELLKEYEEIQDKIENSSDDKNIIEQIAPFLPLLSALTGGKYNLQLGKANEQNEKPKEVKEENNIREFTPTISACIEYLEAMESMQIGLILSSVELLYNKPELFEPFYNCIKNNFGLIETVKETVKEPIQTENIFNEANYKSLRILSEKLTVEQLQKLANLAIEKPHLIGMLNNL